MSEIENCPKAIEALLEKQKVKGFLPFNEAELLHRVASDAAKLGSLLEVGTYCGRSAVYLGQAAKACNQVLYTVDHHRGSEEHQLGEGYHDPDLYDGVIGRVDTLPELRKNLYLCGVEEVVIPIVAKSENLAKHWTTPLAFIFIDGGHSEVQATADCLGWVENLHPEGVMAIHDIYETPEEGGQAPLRALETLLSTHPLTIIKRQGSLVILKRLS